MNYINIHKKSIIESVKIDKVLLKLLLLELLFIVLSGIIILLFSIYISKTVYSIWIIIQPLMSGYTGQPISQDIINSYTLFLWKSFSALLITILLMVLLTSTIHAWQYSLLRKYVLSLQQFKKYFFMTAIYLLIYMILFAVFLIKIKDIYLLTGIFLVLSSITLYLTIISYAILWRYTLFKGIINSIKYASKLHYTIIPFSITVLVSIIGLLIILSLLSLVGINTVIIIITIMILFYLVSAVFIKRYVYILSKYLTVK